MSQAILFAKVGDVYHVAVIKDAGNLKSKYLHTRENAVAPLFGAGWRSYAGPTFKSYAAVVAHARELQQKDKGKMSIFEVSRRHDDRLHIEELV